MTCHHARRPDYAEPCPYCRAEAAEAVLKLAADWRDAIDANDSMGKDSGSFRFWNRFHAYRSFYLQKEPPPLDVVFLADRQKDEAEFLGPDSTLHRRVLLHLMRTGKVTLRLSIDE